MTPPPPIAARLTDGLDRLGRWTIDVVREAAHTASVAAAIGWRAGRPGTWRRTVRAELVRQIYYTGVRTVRLPLIIAAVAGAGIVFQIVRFAGQAGQREFSLDLLLQLLINYLGPILVAMLVVGRSGMAIIGELTTMRLSRQIDLLESQGIDPLRFIVLPRVLAMAVCVPLLTVLFIAATLAIGHGVALGFGAAQQGPMDFAGDVLRLIGPAVYLRVLLTTMLSGYFIGVAACLTGLQARPAITEVPRLLPTGFVRCTLTVFLIIAALTAAF